MIAAPSRFLCKIENECISDKKARFLVISTWLLFTYASGTNLVFLVLERYIAVGKPLKYLTFMKHRRVIRMVLTSWGIPFLFSLTVSLQAIRFNSDDRIRTVPGYFCLLFEVMLCMILTFCLASKFLVVYKQKSRDLTLIMHLHFNRLGH